jgi:hypothetical protein
MSPVPAGHVSPRKRALRPRLLIMVVLTLSSVSALGEEKKDAKKEEPHLSVVAPLAVTPGSTVILKLVGSNLDAATGVIAGPAATTRPAQTQPASQPTSEPATQPAGLQITIKKKDKAPVPMGDEGAKAGSSLLEIEIKVPADQPTGELPLAVVTPAGRSEPIAILVLPANTVQEDRPARNGFKDAPAVVLNEAIRGVISEKNAVDVYRFTGRSGGKIEAEVLARRRHSLLDSLIVLYDEQGHLVADNDDGQGIAPDSLLKQTLPRDGVYFLTVTDANSRGGPQFPYLLTIRENAN